jgi:hypothetical protein
MLGGSLANELCNAFGRPLRTPGINIYTLRPLLRQDIIERSSDGGRITKKD